MTLMWLVVCAQVVPPATAATAEDDSKPKWGAAEQHRGAARPEQKPPPAKVETKRLESKVSAPKRIVRQRGSDIGEVHILAEKGMRWLRLVGSFKLQVSFAEYSLFSWALLH